MHTGYQEVIILWISASPWGSCPNQQHHLRIQRQQTNVFPMAVYPYGHNKSVLPVSWTILLDADDPVASGTSTLAQPQTWIFLTQGEHLMKTQLLQAVVDGVPPPESAATKVKERWVTSKHKGTSDLSVPLAFCYNYLMRKHNSSN